MGRNLKASACGPDDQGPRPRMGFDYRPIRVEAQQIAMVPTREIFDRYDSSAVSR